MLETLYHISRGAQRICIEEEKGSNLLGETNDLDDVLRVLEHTKALLPV
jgi:hypothetical protein